jgi:hypothetical protein
MWFKQSVAELPQYNEKDQADSNRTILHDDA